MSVGAVKGKNFQEHEKVSQLCIGILRVISMYTAHRAQFPRVLTTVGYYERGVVLTTVGYYERGVVLTTVGYYERGVVLRYYRYCDIITAAVNRARRGGGGVVMIY